MADETEADAATPAPGAATTDAAATTRATGEAFLAAPAGDATEDDDWSPPQTRDDGVAVDGDGLPINRRLRAIDLVDSGKAEDPGGVLSRDEIESTAKRLAAYDKQHPRVTGRTSLAELTRLAEDAGVSLDGAASNAERVERILAARPPRI